MTKNSQLMQTETMTEEEYSMYLAYGYSKDADVYENWDVFTSDCAVIIDTGYYDPVSNPHNLINYTRV